MGLKSITLLRTQYTVENIESWEELNPASPTNSVLRRHVVLNYQHAIALHRRAKGG
jgi:hypothetical protein